MDKLIEITSDMLNGTSTPTSDTTLSHCFAQAVESPDYSDISFLVKDEELVLAHKVC